MIRISAVVLVAALITAPPPPSRYLYIWTASADSTAPDYLAVFDIERRGDRYGRLVTTVPVPGRGNVPHHTEHAVAADDPSLPTASGRARPSSSISRIPRRPSSTASSGMPGR